MLSTDGESWDEGPRRQFNYYLPQIKRRFSALETIIEEDTQPDTPYFSTQTTSTL